MATNEQTNCDHKPLRLACADCVSEILKAEVTKLVNPIIAENEIHKSELHALKKHDARKTGEMMADVKRIEELEAKLQKAIEGIEHIKKNALWGVEVNCDAVIKFLKS